MKLMIVESPGKIKKIREILGRDWIVAASMGHVRDLPEKDLGVNPPNFKPSYVETPRGKDVLAKLKQQVKNCDEVYLATDLDREGEAIAWHLQQSLNLKNPKRITFAEITPKAITTALDNPRAIDIKMVAAQETRRVLDRLVGYMVSPKLSHLTGQKGLSAGRVQSPAVRIISEREQAIAAFKPTNHFGIRAEFDFYCAADFSISNLANTQTKNRWFTDCDIKDFLKQLATNSPEKSEYLTDINIAKQIAAIKDFKVIAYEEKQSAKAPPAPFITSTLQQAASSKFKYKPKQTMDVAQKLYEQGHITYMRTDNPNLSADALLAIKKVCQIKNLSIAAKTRTWQAKEGSQEAHEAIRPTHFDCEKAGETIEQQNLYHLIWQQAVASQLQAAIYAVKTVKLQSLVKVQGICPTFSATGKTLISKGYLDMTDISTQTDDNQEANNSIPALKQSNKLLANSCQIINKTTKALPRFSEANLIAQLEKQGIGRPSTYASIMDNISKREYVKYDEKGNNLVPTAKGSLIMKALTAGKFSFINFDFTKKMEDELDQIAAGKLSYQQVVSTVFKQLEQELANLKLDKTLGNKSTNFVNKNSAMPTTSAAQYKCPTCKSNLVKRQGKNGVFWGCSSYPSCTTSFSDIKGKPNFNYQKAKK